MTDYELTLMNEAPKKIWMMENPQAWATRDDMFNTPYIRADLMDELVEALEGLLTDITEYQEINNLGGQNNHWQVKAKAALAKLEESHD